MRIIISSFLFILALTRDAVAAPPDLPPDFQIQGGGSSGIGGNVTGGIGGPGTGGLGIDISDYTLLVLSVVLFTISLYLAYEGSRFQKWTTAGDEAAPDPKSGLDYLGLVSIIILLLWVPYWIYLPGDRGNFMEFIVTNARSFSPAFFLASIPPAMVALLKFSVAAYSSYYGGNKKGVRLRSPVPSLLGVIITLISLSASIVTLVQVLS